MTSHNGVCGQSAIFSHRQRAPKTIVVTGGAGYLGSVLVRKLIAREYRVIVFDRLLYRDGGVSGLKRCPGFEMVAGDVRNPAELAAVLRGARAVAHLAAIVGDPACALDESAALEVNLKSTATLTQAAQSCGVGRLIFASSCAVYGAAEGVVDETAPPNPLSLYAKTKAAAERVVLDGAGTVLRFATLYGLSPRPRLDLLVNLFAAQAIQTGEITMIGGRQWRPFLHVADAAAAILSCLEAPPEAVRGEIFNAGADSQNYRVKEIAALVRQLVPGLKVHTRPHRGGADYRVSFAKIRDRLHFAPARTLQEGIVEIIEAIRRGDLPNPHDRCHTNPAALQHPRASAASPPKP